MKKTVNINLAGFRFHLDEDAYKRLEQYINELKSLFANTKNGEEIINDVEARFAEMFQEKLSEGKEVINLQDVEDIILVMGEPEQYIDDELEDDFKSSGKKSSNKRIYRNPDDQIAGGVCGGLAAYLGVDPIVFRLFFVILFFGFGTGILLYIILWIVIPEAKTTAQKLEMRGEPVNLNNIGKSVRDEWNNLESSVKKSDFRNIIQQIVSTVLAVLKAIFIALSKVIGVIMIIIGIAFLIMVISSIFGGEALFTLMSNGSFSVSGWEELFDLIFNSTGHGAWLLLSSILFITLPILYVSYLGLRIVFKIEELYKPLKLVLLGIWILSIISMFANSVRLASSFDDNSRIYEKTIITPSSDTLTVDGFSSGLFEDDNEISEEVVIDDNQILLRNVDFDIKPSKDSLWHVRVMSHARGGSKKSARKRAENIEFNFNFKDNTLSLPDYIIFDKADKIRAQEVDVILYVPEGKYVYLDRGIEDIIDDIHNVQNIYDPRMVGHMWQMNKVELDCLDCY